MKIKALELTNYRCFEHFKIDFCEQLTVLVARNGKGKTTILDAIATALGPYLTRLGVVGNNFKGDDLRIDSYHRNEGLASPFVRITAKSYCGLKWDRTKKRDQKKKTEDNIPQALGLKALYDHVDAITDAHLEKRSFELPIFLYYGAGRGVFDIPQRKKGFGQDFNRFEAFSGGLESRTNFRRFVDYFYQLRTREMEEQSERQSFDFRLPELEAIRASLSKAIPEMSNPRPGKPAGIIVDWNDGHTSKTLRLEQFSDGYRTTLAMIMDIASRMAEANPDMENPLLTEGIIMIDEVDLHLHPGWQQTILIDLRRAFPNAQFIVSTHSPQILTTVESKAIRAIEWQDGQPRLVPVDFSLGAEAHLVLMQILGVSPRPQELEIVKALIQYQDLVNANQWDSPKAKALREQLDEWGHEYEPELAALDMDIRLKELDRSS